MELVFMEFNLNLNLNIDKNKEFYKTIAAITIPIALQNIISYDSYAESYAN